MSNVRIQPLAQTELEDAATWYEAQRPGLGLEFHLEFDAALERVERVPEAFARHHHEVRRVLLRRFPNVAYFILVGGVVEVVAVLRQRLAPGHWVP